MALAALTALRLAMAATMPLAPDEAYYWVWSRALAPGFYDHPPMVALWIAAGSALAGDTALGVRLLGPLAAALGTLMLADAADRLFPGRRAGIVAGTLFNATLIMGVGSVIMTPDSPLLLFWTGTIWSLARIAPADGTATTAGSWWLAAGLFGGLALVSKYTAAFLGAGVALWLVLMPSMRPWLRRPWPWAGLALALLTFAPVVMWNATHDWAGFLRQAGRVTSWHAGRALQFLAELFGGQAGLATPGIWLLCLAGIGVAVCRTWRDRDAGWSLLACLTVPTCLYVLWYALGSRVQGNWPAIIYPAATIAAAGLIRRHPIVGDQTIREPRSLWERMLRPSVVLGVVITGLAYFQAASGLIPLPIAVDPIALRLADWDRVSAHVNAEQRRAGAAFVASDQYALAAALAWILPAGTPVLGIEDRWRLFALPSGHAGGTTGILVRDSRDRTAFDPQLWRSVQRLSEVDRGTVQTLHLFLVELAVDAPTIVTLPRPTR